MSILGNVIDINNDFERTVIAYDEKAIKLIN